MINETEYRNVLDRLSWLESENRELRYERLMAKAQSFRRLREAKRFRGFVVEQLDKCERIADGLERRAMKIKEVV